MSAPDGMTELPRELVEEGAKFGFGVAQIASLMATIEFETPFNRAYYTKGDSYLIASRGKWNDDGQRRDLMIVLPAVLTDRRVIVLRPTVNPDFAAFVEKVLAL